MERPIDIIDPAEQTPLNTEETTEEISSLNDLFSDSEFKTEEEISKFKEDEEEIELNGVSVLVGLDNTGAFEFQEEIIKLDPTDTNYNAKLYELLYKQDSNYVSITKKLFNKIVDNIANNIDELESLDPDVREYFEKSVNEIITTNGEIEGNIDLIDKENSNKVEKSIQKEAEKLQYDSRLQKIKKLPWNKILGGIFGFSTYTVCLILLTYFLTIKLNAEKYKNYTIEKYNNDELKKYNTVYLYLMLSKLISGCYMINGNTVVRLDGCSEWYKDPKNMSKCSCKNISNNSCTSEDCEYPSCNGTPNCNNQIKCTNKLNIPLNFCNQNLGDNFVYYTYQSLPKFSLSLTSKSLKNAIKNIKNPNKSNLSNLLKIIGYIFLFLFLTILIIIFYNFFKKKNV